MIQSADALTRRDSFGVTSRLKSISKHRILGLGNRVSCAKAGVPISTIYTSCFLARRCPLAVVIIVLNFSGVFFIAPINSLTR